MLAVVPCAGAATPLQGSQDPYEEGQALREAGDWEGALDLWMEARDDLSTRGIHDPRMGIAFVELVAEQEAEAFFGEASDMLLWGFSSARAEPYLDTYSDEVDRVLPLMEEDEAEEWKDLRDDDPDALPRALKKFWIERDPTPGTRVNERLIEHWRRIHYARTHFQHTFNSPYDTDDRGTIYVKFGPPTRTQSGMLGATELELQIRVPDAEQREAMRRYDVAPQYEVWVYDTLNSQDFTFFLFGNLNGTGPFRLVDGVHDLIPDQAKSRASARYTPGGVPVMYYLELFYYQDLSRVGGYFGRRFSELDILWNDYTFAGGPARSSVFGGAGVRRLAPSESTLESFSYRYRQEDEYHPPTPPEAPVLSEYEGRARDQLYVQAVRLLSDEDEPLLILQALSAPRMSVAASRGVYEGRLGIPGYWMRHTLIVRDEALTEVGRWEERITSSRGDVSTFVLRHPNRPMHLTVTAETLHEDETEPAPGPPFPGQFHVEPEAPLSSDTAVFEMSDLATGLPIPEGVDPAGLSFPLVPSGSIWRRDPLRVYLELYHVALGSDDVGRLRASFRVIPLRDDGTTDRSRDPVTLSFDLDTDSPTYKETFDIALADQELGRYRLEVEVTDRIRNQTRTRTSLLELIG